ncbi:nucleotidyltransferase domain-containing protein [Alistipes communis]|uniref:nucleotidyltransferase domain-containing protein n=1 Tax=Alistipes communis TaxID=2585118 RepID=UPI00030D1020|nr:nucleotidyltransferase family protein [Alistipes communis]
MNDRDSALLWLLRRSLGSKTSENIAPLSSDRWKDIYQQTACQGILALSWRAVEQLPSASQPPRDIKLRWAYNAEQIRLRYRRQLAVATALASSYADEGIRTVVLKGLALSRYYPDPECRECGDFDCFLCGEYEQGNRIARALGAEVDDRGYRHSHIEYKGLTIENHRYCLTVRADRHLKRLEQVLQRMAIDDFDAAFIRNTRLILPPPMFHALFLTQHALHHFLVEGIALRHLCDWGLFLKHEAENLDWPLFYEACRRNDMLVFANTLTAICVEKLGIDLPDRIVRDRRFMEPVWHDTLRNDNRIYDKGLGLWAARWATLKNMYRHRWKYTTIYGRDYRKEIIRSVYGILFEKTK